MSYVIDYRAFVFVRVNEIFSPPNRLVDMNLYEAFASSSSNEEQGVCNYS